MRRRFRMLLFLLIVFSFLIGYPLHTLDLEVVSVSRIINSNGGVLDGLKVLLLIITHLALLSLLFIKDGAGYKRYLVWFPILFLIVDAINARPFFVAEPRLMLTALPYCVTYLICLLQYSLLHKTEKANSAG